MLREIKETYPRKRERKKKKQTFVYHINLEFSFLYNDTLLLEIIVAYDYNLWVLMS